MHAQAPSNLARRRCLAGVPLLAVGLFVRPALADPAVQHASRRLLGTQVDIVAQGAMPGAAAPAIDAAFAEMARLERLMSRYRPDSQVSALARAAGQEPVPVAPEVMAILKLAARVFGLCLAEAGVAQDVLQRQAVVLTQLTQHAGRGHAAAEIPELPGQVFQTHR